MTLFIQTKLNLIKTYICLNYTRCRVKLIKTKKCRLGEDERRKKRMRPSHIADRAGKREQKWNDTENQGQRDIMKTERKKWHRKTAPTATNTQRSNDIEREREEKSQIETFHINLLPTTECESEWRTRKHAFSKTIRKFHRPLGINLITLHLSIMVIFVIKIFISMIVIKPLKKSV